MQKKILLLAPYSYPSACGVWQRVYSDAKALIDEGYEVSVFTSNVIKGTNQTSAPYEEYEGIKIYRFPVWFSLGGTSMFWNFWGAFSKVNPDIVHTHVYRHPHSFFSLILGKLKGKKVLLTTHAPFQKDPNRNIIMKAFDVFYDLFIGWWQLKLFNKVIRISKWEEKYLKALGIKNSEYIPNGINKKFLATKTTLDNKPNKKALYMGRLDPVKRVDLITMAAKELTEVNIKLRGPMHGYKISDFEQTKNLQIQEGRYTADDFIQELETTDIYILPSIREALSITTLEAMAQGVIPIVSQALGPSDFIVDGQNGFVFKDLDELVEKINYVYGNWNEMKSVRENAIETARKYEERVVNGKLIEVYEKL